MAQGLAAAPLPEAIFSVPLHTVAHLLGFADQVLPQVERWTCGFVACLSPPSDAAQWQGASSAAATLMGALRGAGGDGHGVHACPGEALACTLAAAGLQALLPQPAALDTLRARGCHYRPSTNARIPVFH